jgi:hypothetical protein
MHFDHECIIAGAYDEIGVIRYINALGWAATVIADSLLTARRVTLDAHGASFTIFLGMRQ